MKNYYVLVFIFSLNLDCNGQRENTWLIGQGFGFQNISVSFNSGSFFDTLTGHSIPISGTNACISDTLGNLLFYTNGVNVYTAQHDTMQNGTGLNPSTYTQQNQNYGLTIMQSALILPAPDSSNLYYLFHYTIDTTYTISAPLYEADEVHVFYYSIIDMSRNGGLGECVAKNIHLLNDTLNCGGLTMMYPILRTRS